MISKITGSIYTLIDCALYGFIGPFSVLYIIPRFLMETVPIHTRHGFGFHGVAIAGGVIMEAGAALALWCTALMFYYGKGSPFLSYHPEVMLNRNVYSYLRNPMMWSIYIVLFGEIFLFGHPALIFWWIAMLRIGYKIVKDYEEPELERRFGAAWIEYSRKVPAWLPIFPGHK